MGMMQLSTDRYTPQLYQLRLREHLVDDEAAWFRPLTLTRAIDGTTTLTGPIRDQAELHGLLIKIRDLNLTLLSVINLTFLKEENHGTRSTGLHSRETCGQ